MMHHAARHRREATPQIGSWTLFLLLRNLTCLMTFRHSVIRNLPCLMPDLHSHMNSVHLTCKRPFAHERSLEPGRHSCTVKAQDVCGHCWKVFKSRGSLEDHARSHGGSLPYPCNKCLIHFRYRNQLRRHSKKCLS